MILADTHAFFWWIHDRGKLSRTAYEALRSTDQIAISTITCWELAMLITKRRLGIPMDAMTWILEAMTRTRVEAIPLQLAPAIRAAEFTQLRDPADQQIVATALDLDVPLVTKDRRIRASGIVPTIW